MTDVDVATAMLDYERLRAGAARAAARADDALALAAEIGRWRAVVLARDDAALARHTEEVWSSRAAAHSRVVLQRGVGRILWTAAEELAATRRALESRAEELRAEAHRLHAAADVALALTRPPAPVMALDQAASSFTSNPVPRGNR